MTRLARRLRQQGGGPLSPTLVSALAAIERHGPLTPSEVAEIERVQRPTATRAIGRLEQEGLLARSADESDRRVARLEITAEGRRLLRALRTRKTAYLARRLERLAPEERAVLARAAEILERLLEEEA